MRYKKPFHLFNSSGQWIGFCLVENVFDTDTVWRGWLPWEESADAVTPGGSYFGTVIGNRLYYFEHKWDLRVTYYPGYPAIPVLPEPPKPASAKALPEGAKDVDLKYVPWQPIENLSPSHKGKENPRRDSRKDK